MMERAIIIERLTLIFREAFNDSSLVLKDEMTAADVDGWDSLTHMFMIAKVEASFGIKLKLKELNRLKQVGDIIAILEEKCQ